MKLFTNKTDILAAIADVNTTGKKLDNMIWVAAASIVAHIQEHREVSLANQLIDAMPKGSRVNALIAYFDATSQAAYEVDAKTFVFSRSKVTDQALAISKSWVEYKPEQPYGGTDLHALILKAIKSADTALASTDSTKRSKDKINVTELAALKTLATSMGIELPKAKEAKAPAAPEKAVEADPLVDSRFAEAPRTLETA